MKIQLNLTWHSWFYTMNETRTKCNFTISGHIEHTTISIWCVSYNAILPVSMFPIYRNIANSTRSFSAGIAVWKTHSGQQLAHCSRSWWLDNIPQSKHTIIISNTTQVSKVKQICFPVSSVCTFQLRVFSRHQYWWLYFQ